MIDGTEDWLQLMKAVFHFPSLRRLIQSPSFSFVFDGMHGVAGPTAERLFVHELGAKATYLRACNPLVWSCRLPLNVARHIYVFLQMHKTA